MKPLSQYIPVCQSMSREAFVQRYPGPFLVHSSRAGGALIAPTGGRTLDHVVLDDGPQDEDSEVQSVFTVSQFAPRGPELAIGTDPGSGVHIPAASVSRVHARLIAEGGRWKLEDAGSSMGTWVNGESVDPGNHRFLDPGDRVSLGALDLTFYPAWAFYDLVMSGGEAGD